MPSPGCSGQSRPSKHWRTPSRAGLDPATTTPRMSVPAPAGELLLMPAVDGGSAGVKVVGVAPANGRLGLPRVQGLFLLFDAATLTPRAVLDGAALTTLRTPAVSVAAVRSVLDGRQRPVRAVVFGAGPQGAGHLENARGRAGAAVPPPEAVLESTVVVRKVARARLPSLDAVSVRVLALEEDAAVRRALEQADLVVCATTAQAPLFAADVLRQDAVVVAVGAHDPEAQEVETSLAGAGPASSWRTRQRRVARIRRGARRRRSRAPRPRGGSRHPRRRRGLGSAGRRPPSCSLSRSVSAWEDLVIADRLYRAHRESNAQS